MEIYEIKNCDCSLLKDRIKLVKATMEAIHCDEKPTKEQLNKICKSLRNKYGMQLKNFKQKNGKIFASIETERGSYSTFVCLSYYELMCKYILFVKAMKEYRKLVANED